MTDLLLNVLIGGGLALAVVLVLFLVLRRRNPAAAAQVAAVAGDVGGEASDVAKHAISSLQELVMHAQSKLHQSTPVPPAPIVVPEQQQGLRLEPSPANPLEKARADLAAAYAAAGLAPPKEPKA